MGLVGGATPEAGGVDGEVAFVTGLVQVGLDEGGGRFGADAGVLAGGLGPDVLDVLGVLFGVAVAAFGIWMHTILAALILLQL